jgi:hypothetical protein
MSSETVSSQVKEKGPEIQPGSPVPLRGETTSAARARRRSRRKQALTYLAGLLLVYFAVAYLIMPAAWKRYVHRHPALEHIPNITHTGNGIPGDPINCALVGTETDVVTIMVAAKWDPADPLTLRSCLRIAAASVLKRPYDDAPVSNLYLFGRKQDLAFQQPVGNDPRKRHHVRFWKTDKIDPDGRPVWAGAAIYDRRVGLSHTTGQITHHTAADIDAERDKLFDDLKQSGDLAEFVVIDGFRKVREGHNGGGDPWYTDGNLYAGVIKVMNP